MKVISVGDLVTSKGEVSYLLLSVDKLGFLARLIRFEPQTEPSDYIEFTYPIGIPAFKNISRNNIRVVDGNFSKHNLSEDDIHIIKEALDGW